MTDIAKTLRDINLDGSGSARVDMACVAGADEIDRLRAALATEAERTRVLTEAVEKPLTIPEMIEVGQSILRYIASEETAAVGSIAFDAAVAVKRIILARAAIHASAPSPAQPDAADNVDDELSAALQGLT